MIKRRQVVVERDVGIKMRDGVLLRADVYRMADARRSPVLLQRTPYDKQDSFVAAHQAGLEPLRAVDAGFAVVIQDVRGCNRSEGTFRPFVHESDDGVDTIRWLVNQPWCDGRVGMYGMSYLGVTQLVAACEDPKGLIGIAPHQAAFHPDAGWFYQGGAFRLGFAVCWALNALLPTVLERSDLPGSTIRELRDRITGYLSHPDEAFSQLPLDDLGGLAIALPDWHEWVRGGPPPGPEEIAKRTHERINVPALHIGGWYDLFLDGTLRNYSSLRAGAISRRARTCQHLLIGPWAHAVVHEAVGEVDFGPTASQRSIDITAVQLDWFRHCLGRKCDGPRVRHFVMGTNYWQDEDDWPPPRMRLRRCYLMSKGRLSWQAPSTDDPPDQFVYDPHDPVPTVGGSTFLPGLFVGLNAGARRQPVPGSRPDVETYCTLPLEQPLRLAGPLTARLSVSTDAPDTDWTAKLIDVAPDGTAILIADGILRARYSDGSGRARLLPANVPHHLAVDIGDTSYELRRGHRLRLDVSSSNFPRFDRNPNHGGDLAAATGADFRPARQTIYHDTQHQSFLELPMLD